MDVYRLSMYLLANINLVSLLKKGTKYHRIIIHVWIR